LWIDFEDLVKVFAGFHHFILRFDTGVAKYEWQKNEWQKNSRGAAIFFAIQSFCHPILEYVGRASKSTAIWDKYEYEKHRETVGFALKMPPNSSTGLDRHSSSHIKAT